MDSIEKSRESRGWETMHVYLYWDKNNERLTVGALGEATPTEILEQVWEYYRNTKNFSIHCIFPQLNWKRKW